MDLLKETVDHAADRFDSLLDKRISQLSAVFDDKIAELRRLANGMKLTTTTTLDAPEVKAAQPIDWKQQA